MPLLRAKCDAAVIAMYTATPEDAATAMEIGADAVLDKIDDPQELLDLLVTLIDGRHSTA